ncbi:MAG: pyrroline-5-carboxylate reductase [Chloroflexota bacterium]
MKIAFIGGGNMGEAMLSAILTKNLATLRTVTVSDASEARRNLLREKYKVDVTADNRAAVSRGDTIILAVKPQSLPEVLTQLKGALQPSQLVLSIIAGARMSTLQEGLWHKSIVRVMPNTPAQIGEGMSVWTATPEVTPEQKERAKAILGTMGRELYVSDEDDIDKATAVSGSGPAYVFLFVEALVSAAQKLGFSPEVAKLLVLQTLLGSSHFLAKSGREPEDLRRMVTSPGGTTAAALARFEKGEWVKLVEEAVAAAYNRAKELGK